MESGYGLGDREARNTGLRPKDLLIATGIGAATLLTGTLAAYFAPGLMEKIGPLGAAACCCCGTPASVVTGGGYLLVKSRIGRSYQ